QCSGGNRPGVGGSPMSEEPSFEQVLARLRERDDDAARHVYERFVRRLVALARGQLDRRLQQRLDPEDVVQSGMRSAFLRLADGQFALHDWESLWGLLARVTVFKCYKWQDHFSAGKRDLGREAGAPVGGKSDAAWEPAGREPSPEEAAFLAEAIERM